MGKSAGSGIDERSIGGRLRDGAPRHILVGLDGKEHVVDIGKVRASVISAKNKRRRTIWRIALVRRQTDINTFGKKNMIDVVVARAMRAGGDVDELQDVGLRERGGQGLFNIGSGAA